MTPSYERRAVSPSADANICGPMRLRPSKPELLADLRQHFARFGFSVAEERGGLVVRRAEGPSVDQEDEIEVHLRVWQAMHPDVQVAIKSH